MFEPISSLEVNFLIDAYALLSTVRFGAVPAGSK
jgi:hypothetical protein